MGDPSNGVSITAQAGELRNSKDFVRIEIGAALRRGVFVLPVLVDGVPMPAAEALPQELGALTARQALPIVDAYFEEGMSRLLGALDKARTRHG